MNEYTKWVACYGNATSIADNMPAMYAKDLTLRYPVYICFSGDKLRFRFSNQTGTQTVCFTASVAKSISDREIDENTLVPITLTGARDIVIEPGCEITSDEISFNVVAGEYISINIYCEDYTQLYSGTLITGPLSKGFYSYGNYAGNRDLPEDKTRGTNWFYFLNTIDVHTEEKNHALICYGDSITAQDWPDELALRAKEKGFNNVSIIRRAVSGTRILRQYDCTTYAAYGLKGATRFPIESNVSGASAIIIQHGINDIIHPVGEEINIFRPMSDLPTVGELCEAVRTLYIEPAKKMGLKVYGGTLLPILGWRTYADFREDLKNSFNEWLRTTDLLDGCIDFDKAVRDENDARAFAPGYDSGDHLHPSKAAYKRMAETVPEELLK